MSRTAEHVYDGATAKGQRVVGVRCPYCEVVVGHKLTSAGDLTRTEASAVITALQDAASDPESEPDEDGVIA